MQVLTPEEQRQLDKDLEWKLARKDEEIEETVQQRQNLEQATRDFFKPFVEFYNQARDYYYSKLDAKYRYKGDFRTMEVTASISEDFELILTGVWGSRCLTVRRKGDGFELRLGDGVTKKVLASADVLRVYLLSELHDDHPMVQEKIHRIWKEQERLKEVRHKVGCE